jgi:hypothetical protein
MVRTQGSKDLTPQIRSRICELARVNGWGPSRIQKEHPTIKRDTIKKTIKLEAIRNDNQSRNRTGRRPILDETDRRFLIETSQNLPDISYEDLLESVDNRCGKTTIWRLFNEHGIRKWKHKYRPPLNEYCAAQRLGWALTYMNLTSEEWAKVCSDKCTIDIVIKLNCVRPLPDRPSNTENSMSIRLNLESR